MGFFAQLDAAWVSAIGTWVYNVLMLASLTFLWFQLRSIKQQLKSAGFQGIWVLWIEIDKWFVANPSMKPYFYHGKDINKDVSEETRMKLESTAEMLLDCYANVFHQKDCMSAGEAKAYHKFMRNVYNTQPFFHRFVEDHTQWYLPEFIEYLTGLHPKQTLPPAGSAVGAPQGSTLPPAAPAAEQAQP